MRLVTSKNHNRKMEKLKIKDFGGIDELEIEINTFNIFIGKQATGKSITVKLIYFFKGIFREIFRGIMDEKSKTEIDKSLIYKFQEYFPNENWSNKKFIIEYYINDHHIRIYRKEKNKIKIEYSEIVKKQFTNCRRLINSDKKNFQPKDNFEIYRPNFNVNEKFYGILTKEIGGKSGYSQFFIPAGRSFFANLQSSIFSFLSNNKAIDPFLVEFGSFYESIKPIADRNFRGGQEVIANKFDEIAQEIINSKYFREKNKDYLLHRDKRKINVSFSSSGQQETLPLILILKAFLRLGFSGSGATLYIEEPEAHLFPSAQKKMIELLALVANHSRSPLQLFITTHSPYVLSTFNNLTQAGIVNEEIDDVKQLELFKIVLKESVIKPNELNAYALMDRSGKSIIDKDTGLVYAEYLDSISEEIADEFENILNLI